VSLIVDLFGKSPFGPLVEHTRKVHECAKLVRPLMEAMIREDYEEVHRLQDEVSRLEHEADQIKHDIREHLPHRVFLPVQRGDFDLFLHSQDRVADSVEDYAVVLLIRNTKIHPSLAEDFLAFVDQVVSVVNMLMSAAEELTMLAETSFGGAQADVVLDRLRGLGEAEWKCDRMQRRLSQRIYAIEDELGLITVLFYEKILLTLSAAANAAENTGDLLRTMIVKG